MGRIRGSGRGAPLKRSISAMRRICVLFFSLIAASCASMEQEPAPSVAALAAAQACDQDHVLIGEASDHGRGATLAVKSELVRRLIEDCGYNVVLFESGYYDFARILLERSGGVEVSPEQVASSIGGIWNRYAEVADLVPFLTRRINGGALMVGGLDFNLGSAGAFYSIDAMPADLAALVDGEAAAHCELTLRRLIYMSYGAQGPQPADIQEILACSSLMEAGIEAGQRSDLESQVVRRFLVNVEAYASALTAPREQRLQAREAAFWDNFLWWRSQAGADAKIIVWGASVHMAQSPPDNSLFQDIDTFGERVERSFPERSHFVNFVSVSGSYRFLDRAEELIPPPSSNSVEAQMSNVGRDVYLDPQAVVALGERPSMVFSVTPVTAPLASITDGLIVIARERPPVLMDPDEAP